MCSEPGCDREVVAKGLCSKHYQRMRFAIPEVRARRNARQREYKRNRYQNEPEVRRRKMEVNRASYRRRIEQDPNFAEAERQRRHERYDTPEYRRSSRRRARRLYASDPEYRERVKQKARARGRERIRRHRTYLIDLQDGLCGRPGAPGGCGQLLGDDIHIDHIIPRSKGGPSTRDNLQALHARCNQRKGAR